MDPDRKNFSRNDRCSIKTNKILKINDSRTAASSSATNLISSEIGKTIMNGTSLKGNGVKSGKECYLLLLLWYKKTLGFE